MFAALKAQAPDKSLALMGEFKADTRQGKIDLGVGVYKDPTGLTPVMRAVKAAEKRRKAEERKARGDADGSIFERGFAFVSNKFAKGGESGEPEPPAAEPEKPLAGWVLAVVACAGLVVGFLANLLF